MPSQVILSFKLPAIAIINQCIANTDCNQHPQKPEPNSEVKGLEDIVEGCQGLRLPAAVADLDVVRDRGPADNVLEAIVKGNVPHAEVGESIHNLGKKEIESYQNNSNKLQLNYAQMTLSPWCTNKVEVCSLNHELVFSCNST